MPSDYSVQWDGDHENKQTVLVVEPDDERRKAMVNALRKRYVTIEVRHVAMAIRAATRHLPDVVLLSLETLDVPGARAITAFRSACNDPSAIATTSKLDMIREAMAAGADDCVLTPIEPKELIQRIEVAAARGVRLYSGFYDTYDAMRETLREKREHDSTILIQPVAVGG